MYFFSYRIEALIDITIFKPNLKLQCQHSQPWEPHFTVSFKCSHISMIVVAKVARTFAKLEF